MTRSQRERGEKRKWDEKMIVDEGGGEERNRKERERVEWTPKS